MVALGRFVQKISVTLKRNVPLFFKIAFCSPVDMPHCGFETMKPYCPPAKKQEGSIQAKQLSCFFIPQDWYKANLFVAI